MTWAGIHVRRHFDAIMGGDSPVAVANFVSNTSLPSWLTLTRTGHATMFDSTGKLTFAPNNMVQYSNTFDNAYWSATGASVDVTPASDPNGGTAAQKLIETGATSEHRIVGIWPMVNGTTYMVSVYAKAQERSVFVLRGTAFTADPRVRFTLSGDGSYTVDSGSPTASITKLSDGWYRCVMICVATGTSNSSMYLQLYNGAYSYAGSAGSGVYIYNAQIEAVTYETSPRTYNATTSAAYYGPRFDTNPATLAARGLLIEGSRTNDLSYSNDLNTSGWTDTTITRVSTTRTSPTGESNAVEFQAAGANSTVIRTAAVGSSAARTFSIWLKRVSGTGNIQYTLDNGGSWTTQAITSSWERYSFTATTANHQVGIRIVTSGDTIQAFGAQLEAGSVPTSYIPTTTAALTRNADVAYFTGAPLAIFNTATPKGSFVIEAEGRSESAWLSGGPRIISYAISGNANDGFCYVNSDTTTVSWNGTAAMSPTAGSGGWATIGRIAHGFNQALPSRAAAMNGGTVVGDSQIYLQYPGAVSGNSFYLGRDYNGNVGSYWNCWFRGISFYNTKLSNSTLQSKSTVGGSY